MQIVVTIELDLLDSLRLWHKLHETDFFCDCDALVTRESQVLVDLFQQDVHKFEQHQDELILAQVIAIFVNDATSLYLRQRLQSSFTDDLTEDS